MSAYSDMVDAMNDVYAPPLSANSPTAAGTAGQLTSASSNLENLLNIAVGGYTSILGAKAAVTGAKVDLANANKNGVPTSPVAGSGSSPINSRFVIIGAAIVAAVVLALALFRRSKP